MIDQEYLCGAVQSTKDARDYTIKVDKDTVFPETFCVEKMPRVKSQGGVCSCVGHGVATVAEYHNLIQNKVTEPFSAGFIYGYRPNYIHKGKGMSIRQGLSTLKNVGIPYQIDFPYNKEVPTITDLVEKQIKESDYEWNQNIYSHRCSCYFRLHSSEEIKYAIMHYGPVVISIDWKKSFSHASRHMIDDGKKHTGRHCVVIYGWCKEGWLLQNSWGLSWGEMGRSILPFSYKMNEAWCVADDIDDDIKVPVRNWYFYFQQFLNKIVNFFINLRKK